MILKRKRFRPARDRLDSNLRGRDKEDTRLEEAEEEEEDEEEAEEIILRKKFAVHQNDEYEKQKKDANTKRNAKTNTNSTCEGETGFRPARKRRRRDSAQRTR